MQTTTIRIDPPLQCCVQLAVQHRCNAPATVGQATRLMDGSYTVQAFCRPCAEVMARNYGVDADDDGKAESP
jgi:hypothetical protein